MTQHFNGIYIIHATICVVCAVLSPFSLLVYIKRTLPRSHAFLLFTIIADLSPSFPRLSVNASKAISFLVLEQQSRLHQLRAPSIEIGSHISR